jgi:hypothetical protein
MKYKTFEGREYVSGAWQDTFLETGCSYSLGDFQDYRGEVTEALSKSLFIIPKLLSGSDYSGGMVERSNFRVFLKEHKEVDGVYELFGGYGTFGIAVRLDVYNSNNDIKEALDALDNYPVINDEDLSEMESEADQELVTDTAKDLPREIDLDKYIPDIDTILEDTDMIEELIWSAVRDLNLNFEHENNSSFIHDEGKIQRYVEDSLLINNCTKLPLLINREWVSETLEQEFKDKLSGGSNE